MCIQWMQCTEWDENGNCIKGKSTCTNPDGSGACDEWDECDCLNQDPETGECWEWDCHEPIDDIDPDPGIIENPDDIE